MPSRLKNLVVDRVDLVPKGANQEAHIVLFKRDAAEIKKQAETLEEILARREREQEAREEKWLVMDAFMESIMSMADVEDRTEQIRLLLRSVTEFVDRMEPLRDILDESEQQEVIAMAEKTADDQTVADEQLQTQIDALQAEVETLKSRAETAEAELAKAQADEPEDIWKGVHPEVQKQFAEMKKSAEAAQAQVEIEKAARVRETCIAKAAGYEYLPVNPDDDWEVFKDIEGLPDKSRARVYELLKAGDAGIHSSGLTGERGSVGTDGDQSAYAKLEKMARDKVEKSGDSLTYSDALHSVLAENPELYADYTRQISGGRQDKGD